ncbi:MAG: hypothetical protein ABW318_24300 [Vicinamibacterales bacterium]
MIWIHVLSGAVCGFLAVGVATLIVRNGKANKYLHAVVSVVALGLLLAVSQAFVTPQLQARYTASKVNESLSANPAFAAIRQHDAATYSQIMGELKSAITKGRSQAEATAAVRSNITTLIQRRIPHASDDAALTYMSVTVQEMTELQQNGGDELCYQFLFPQPRQPIDMSKYVSEATIQADLAALGEVVRTSAVAPQHIPSEADVWDLLEPVVKVLITKYGEDAALLQKPGAPGVDQAKVCAITTEMYRQIVALPPEQGGKLVRYLLAQG